MNLGGIYLTLLVGRGVPRPAPAALLAVLDEVQVLESAEGYSGFRLAFFLSRQGPLGVLGPSVPGAGALQPFDRVRIIVTNRSVPTVLIDGVITDITATPGPDGRYLVTGEDLSAMMDLEERDATYPGQADWNIAMAVLLRYAHLGIVPRVSRAPTDAQPNPLDSPPTQTGETDRSFLIRLAARYGFELHLGPDPSGVATVATWGPPPSLGALQPALSVDMGASTNVGNATFRYDALQAETAEAVVQVPGSGKSATVRVARTSKPSMALRSGQQARSIRKRLLRQTSGETVSEVRGRAQGVVDAASRTVVVGTGELDTGRYPGVLRARRLVGVRGTGPLFDGAYLVREVSHVLRRGQYKVEFEVVRDGTGARLPAVRP